MVKWTNWKTIIWIDKRRTRIVSICKNCIVQKRERIDKYEIELDNLFYNKTILANVAGQWRSNDWGIYSINWVYSIYLSIYSVTDILLAFKGIILQVKTKRIIKNIVLTVSIRDPNKKTKQGGNENRKKWQ